MRSTSGAITAPHRPRSTGMRSMSWRFDVGRDRLVPSEMGKIIAVGDIGEFQATPAK
ncbi:MAG: hypothetical protein JRN25_03785 [Nitrososphaerota archaeon]|nr:hypothetical protein [Nitrososphaerota archaeon]